MAKLFLDDVRRPPDDSWTWCKSAAEALVFVKDNPCEEWALDHDLGGQLAHYGKGPYDFNAPTGLNFLIDCMNHPISLPSRVSIHSTNFEGTLKMTGALYGMSQYREQDIEIIVRPMRGKIMDKTPYYDPIERARLDLLKAAQ